MVLVRIEAKLISLDSSKSSRLFSVIAFLFQINSVTVKINTIKYHTQQKITKKNSKENNVGDLHCSTSLGLHPWDKHALVVGVAKIPTQSELGSNLSDVG